MQPSLSQNIQRSNVEMLPDETRGRKRIDLVVTDYNFRGIPSDLDATPEEMLRSEFRCTIPLAVLKGDISSEALHQAGRMARFCPTEPISSDALLRMVARVFEALGGVLAEPAPRPDHAVQDPYPDGSRLTRLTARERQVLEHVIAGHPNKRTATALGISRRTVEHHRAAIMQKTRAHSVPELVRLALHAEISPSTNIPAP